MSLGSLQREFTLCTAKLIFEAYLRGYSLTYGDAYRDPRVPYGHPDSCHKHRLAVDFNLFDPFGNYLQDTDAYMELGEWWEKQHPLARWGGRFDDGNHFSFEWNGIK